LAETADAESDMKTRIMRYGGHEERKGSEKRGGESQRDARRDC
jgi:hypothetical protein